MKNIIQEVHWNIKDMSIAPIRGRSLEKGGRGVSWKGTNSLIYVDGVSGFGKKLLGNIKGTYINVLKKDY